MKYKVIYRFNEWPQGEWHYLNLNSYHKTALIVQTHDSKIKHTLGKARRIMFLFNERWSSSHYYSIKIINHRE